jgi:alpha-tubulin suppressor-like RCC1 family protein
LLNFLWITLSLFLIGCVSEVNNPSDPVIELEGATTEEIEDGSFAVVQIDYDNNNGYRDELTFPALGNNAFQGQGYHVVLTIDPKGRTITNPSLVLPSNFDFIGSTSSFSSLYGTCGDVIAFPCDIIVLYTPKNNFQTLSEIFFHYVHLGKGYRTRVPVNIKSVGMLNTFAGPYGSISNGVGSNMCAIGPGGEIKCWGSPRHGNLGISDKYSNWGDTADELGDRIPVYESNRDIVKMRLGGEFGCVMYSDNSLKCFGKNNDGALGRNNSQAINIQSLNTIAPIKFPSFLTLQDFSVGEGHVCGHFNNSETNRTDIRCWGRNDLGQSGIGDVDSTRTALGYGFYRHLQEPVQDFTDGIGYYFVPLNLDDENLFTIVSSKHSNCTLTFEGSVKCWGDNLYGQLGLEDLTTRGDNATTGSLFDPFNTGNENLLALFGTNRDPIQIYGGPGEHFCASLTNDKLKCWGKNDSGQLGQDDTNHRGDGINEMGDNLDDIVLPAGHTILDVSLGVEHTCVHLIETANNTHKVRCFGNGASIGSAQANTIGDDVGEMSALQDIDFGSGFTIERIFSSGYHNCALSTEGEVKCFGLNTYGQLGTGNTKTIGDGILEMGNDLIKLSLPTYTEVTDIAIGKKNTCLVLDKRKIACLGDNSSGYINSSRGIDLGTDPGNSGAALAALPLGNNRATQVSVGYDHACAVFDNFQAKCWGKNAYGQLGLGSTKDYIDLTTLNEELPFIDLGSNLFVESIHAGKYFTCAVVSSYYEYDPASPKLPPNRVKCWGIGSNGQTGQGTLLNLGDSPSEMGDNLSYINLGQDDNGDPYTVADFDSGMNHSCAIIITTPDDGLASPRSIKCWGKNDYGQLGLGSSLQYGHDSNLMGSNLPFVKVGSEVARITNWDEVKLGDDFSCARRMNQIYCWGKNHVGQLGIGSTTTIGDNGNEMEEFLDDIVLSNIPWYQNFDTTNGVPIANSKTQWTVGAEHVCVMNSTQFRNIHCWGKGRYLGLGEDINIGNQITNYFLNDHNFVQTRSEASLMGISAQAESTCVYYSDGMAKCWGNGSYLGNGRSHDQGNYYEMSGFLLKLPFLWF